MSIQNILLDANILISGLKDPNSDAGNQLGELLRDDTKHIFITPLIRYEVLRGITWTDMDRYESVKKALDMIEIINIRKEMSDLASDLFRFDRHQKETNGQTLKKINKHNFDVMHFAAAKIQNLTFYSNDKDMDFWELCYGSLNEQDLGRMSII